MCIHIYIYIYVHVGGAPIPGPAASAARVPRSVVAPFDGEAPAPAAYHQ